MKNNNVEKMLEGKGDLSEAKEIMKLASDYKDPADAEIRKVINHHSWIF